MIKPPQFSLITDKDVWGHARGRIAPDKASLFADHLLDGRLRMNYRMKIQGPDYRQWMECGASNKNGRYTMCFGVKDMTVVQLWAVVTPSGNAYDIDIDGGNPLGSLPVEKLRQLTDILIDREREEAILKREAGPKSKQAKKKKGMI